MRDALAQLLLRGNDRFLRCQLDHPPIVQVAQDPPVEMKNELLAVLADELPMDIASEGSEKNRPLGHSLVPIAISL